MRWIFFRPGGETRGGWKIIIILILTFAFFYVLASVSGNILVRLGEFEARELVESLMVDSEIDSGYFYFFLSLQHISMLLAVLIVLKLIDRSSFKEIGLCSPRKNFKDFALGLTLGAFSIILIFTFLFALDQVSIEESLFRPRFTPHLLYGLYLFIIVGAIEEIFVRGYCIRKALDYDNMWIGAAGSSLIFVALHLVNPNPSFMGLFNVFLIGLLFAYMFLKTGNLWMPIGYHITWNYFQGNIFGFPVSGISMEGAYSIKALEENIFTGGAFGLEGGILTTIVILFGFLVVRKYEP